MIVVADNLRITLPAIDRAVEQMNPEPIHRLVKTCKRTGAHAIDINSGPLSKGAEEKMTFIVESIQSACDLPLFIDTTNPLAMAAGLSVCKSLATINGISLEAEKLERFLPLARKYDADIIAYLLRPDGQVPSDAAGRMEAAVELFGILINAGIAPGKIIIDPIVAPLVWQDGNRQNMAVLEVIRTLPDLLGVKVKTIAGLSNLTTGAPDPEKRRRYQSTFLPMLEASGLDMILMNAMDQRLTDIAATCRSITEKTVFSWV